MVYILSANKYFRYRDGRSKTLGWSSILYIGTTKTGAGRPAASAVNKASEAFYHLHGVKTIDVHIVTCAAHNQKYTWKHLEAALLDAFWKRYFNLPQYNKVKPKHEEGHFGSRPLTKLIAQFEKP
jgi:flavin-binding protein dodecin